MIGVWLGTRKPAFDQIVGAALHGLPGGPQPPSRLRDRQRIPGEDAQCIPARLGLSLLTSDVPGGLAKPAAELEDVGDEVGECLVKTISRKFDN